MFKHLLIATDGSDLVRYAMREGRGRAHALGVRVTAMTVTLPFHVFSMKPTMVTDTADRYREDITARRRIFWRQQKREAATARRPSMSKAT